MRLKYTGPHEDGVDIPELDLHVDHGEIIEVDEATGKRLAASSDWQVTSRTGKKEDEG